jgi:CDP-diacylglycerol--glycerol-3-phosphate 3-phosphatidyltransferase
MVPKWLEQNVRAQVEALVARTPVLASLTPDTLTIMTLVLTLGVILLLIQGAFFWAGVLFLIASTCDMLDGALARAKQMSSQFGAFLDSTIDRYSEMLVFLGLLIFYQRTAADPTLYSVLIFLAVNGSLMTSYVRARAESLGFDGRGGLLDRPGRVIILGLGMLSGWTIISLWLLAILTNLSALQRCVNVWQQSRGNGTKRRKLPAAEHGNPG